MLEAVLASFASPTSYSNSFFSSSSSPFSAAGAGRETSRKNPTSTAAALAAEGLELVEAGLERPEPVDVSGSREGGPSSESERNSVDRLLSGTTNDSDDFADFDLDSSGSGGGEGRSDAELGSALKARGSTCVDCVHVVAVMCVSFVGSRHTLRAFRGSFACECIKLAR